MKLEQKVGKEKLIELLSTMPVREINRQYGYSRNALMAARKEYGILAHNQYEAHDALRYENIASEMIVPNTYDEFTIINDEWSAYWLGFIFADGCVYEAKRLDSETPYRGLRIGLAIKDKCHLEMFGKYSGMQVKELMVHNKQNGKSYPSCYVRRQSPKIAFNLMNLGVIPRKSYVDHYVPRISKSLFRHFVRGYFDGDGCVLLNNGKPKSISLLGRKTFLDGICSWLDDYGITYSYVDKLTYHDLRITNMIDVNKFYNIVYSNATIFLPRKYEKFKYNNGL